MIRENIARLLDYAITMKLIEKEDRIYCQNQLLDLFHLDDIEEQNETKSFSEEEMAEQLPDILEGMLNYAAEQGLLAEDTITYRDLLDTKIMGVFVQRPSRIKEEFYRLYRESPEKATDYFYKLSKDSNYIRRDRVKKDMKWTAPTEYGDLDITINLSKPEKDPRAIAAARTAKQSSYPKCQLCVENEGYAGRVNHPARENHRIIPITIQGESWGFQYSPYVYYNEHCIVLNEKHVPMKIDKQVFWKLFDFVRQFPHYFVGSNADLPIVGGSILTHEHFQGGHYEFAMARAEVEKKFVVKGFETVEAGIVKWPMSVIRLSAAEIPPIVELADRILTEWRSYTDEEAFIFANTDGEPHNTITPIARMRDGKYQLDLVLRNNITTEEHPLGVYHPHAELHHIKKENIGLIEVMGLAVLPSRLKAEMEELEEAIVAEKDIRTVESIEKHADWVEGFANQYSEITGENVHEILQKEIGIVFKQVLEDAGVFKRTEEGQLAFQRFLDKIC